MKKQIIISLIAAIAVFTTGILSDAKAKNENSTTVSNKMFSIMMPRDVDGTYEAEKDKRTISIYDSYSKKAGFGGFAFAIKAYKKPSEHAQAPGTRKIGELTSRFGRIYDVVLIQPTDVQFDYVTRNDKTYAPLYKLGEMIDVKGENKYKFVYGAGMHGRDLYKKVLEKHKKALREKWDSKKLEKENMSYMYNLASKAGRKTIGYNYFDVNGDGIDELLIGEYSEEQKQGVIYDIYTMVNRKPKHVVSGGDRNRYYVCDNSFICNEYSIGAGESGTRVYTLLENSVELYPQVYFKYDIYENRSNPWFISYSVFEDKWENVSEKTYKERKKIFDDYANLDFVRFGI